MFDLHSTGRWPRALAGFFLTAMSVIILAGNAGAQEFYRIIGSAPDQGIHNQRQVAEFGKFEPGWWSAQWAIFEYQDCRTGEGRPYAIFSNRWTNHLLGVSNGVVSLIGYDQNTHCNTPVENLQYVWAVEEGERAMREVPSLQTGLPEMTNVPVSYYLKQPSAGQYLSLVNGVFGLTPDKATAWRIEPAFHKHLAHFRLQHLIDGYAQIVAAQNQRLQQQQTAMQPSQPSEPTQSPENPWQGWRLHIPRDVPIRLAESGVDRALKIVPRIAVENYQAGMQKPSVSAQADEWTIIPHRLVDPQTGIEVPDAPITYMFENVGTQDFLALENGQLTLINRKTMTGENSIYSSRQIHWLVEAGDFGMGPARDPNTGAVVQLNKPLTFHFKHQVTGKYLVMNNGSLFISDTQSNAWRFDLVTPLN